jgi:lipopolysaccharide biosynthesis protein
MENPVRVICFYLPQYHPIPENDRWWGQGFTDWTNVTRARPLFPGHYQPHLPADLGFYDLRVPEVREAQAAMAAQYGIHGFCYHHYWFNGRRVLERPFTEVLRSGKPDFPFCLCWANEHWTRRWDGQNQDILIPQGHSEADDVHFIQSLLPAFRDPRYIRVDGKPLLIVYHTALLPNPSRTADIWRNHVQAAGLPGLYLCRAETHTVYGHHPDPASIGFDSAVEFPPHAIFSGRLVPGDGSTPTDEEGSILDYEQVVTHAIHRPTPGYTLLRGVMPSWDNTARRGNRATIFAHSSPKAYEEWLTSTLRWTRRHRRGDEQLVFINAWNEWAEGCHLEPDQRDGRQYLEATQRALRQSGLAAVPHNESSTGEVHHLSGHLLAERLTVMPEAGGYGESPSEGTTLVPERPTLDSVLIYYLLSPHHQFRRSRHAVYRVLKPIWRLWQAIRGRR